MSTDYTSIAILGATGNFGHQVVKALAEHPLASTLSLCLLTRPGSSSSSAHDLKREFSPKFSNCTVSEVDFLGETESVEKALREILNGVEVIVSAVNDNSAADKWRSREVASLEELPAFRAQKIVAKISKEVGVSLFVPSEYGYPTHTIPSDSAMFLVGKKHFLDYLQQIDLPWLIVYAGVFPSPEPIPTPLPPCTPNTPKGTPPFVTTRFHVASYLAHLLLDVLPEATTWGIFRILELRRDELIEVEDGGEQWTLHEG